MFRDYSTIVSTSRKQSRTGIGASGPVASLTQARLVSRTQTIDEQIFQQLSYIKRRKFVSIWTEKYELEGYGTAAVNA